MAKTLLKQFRRLSGLKQSDMAANLGCTQTCYSYYENGKREISSSDLLKCAEIFGCTVDELLGFDKPKGTTETYTIDIADLTFEQRGVITDLIDMYRTKNDGSD